MDRRSLLRTGSALATVSLAGCMSLLDRGVPGYVQLKHLEGDRGAETEEIVFVQMDGDGSDGSIHADVHDRWKEQFPDPEHPVVSDTLASDLERRYDELRYVIGVCGKEWGSSTDDTAGCHNARAGREDFNQVQVYDAVRASWEDPTIEVHEVTGTRTFPGDEG